MVTASTPSCEQRVELVDRRAAEDARDQIALAAIRIGDADQLDAGQPGQHAGVVGAHDADADDADPQRRRAVLHGLHHVRRHSPQIWLLDSPCTVPSMVRRGWRLQPDRSAKHVLIQSVTAPNPASGNGSFGGVRLAGNLQRQAGRQARPRGTP